MDQSVLFAPDVQPAKAPSRFLRPRTMQMVADLIAFSGSFFMYQWLRGMLFGVDIRAFTATENLGVCGIMSLYWMIVFWFGGLYKDMYVRSPFDEFFAVLRLTFFGSAVFFLLIFVSSSNSYQESPRLVFILYWMLITMFAGTGRVLARSLQRRLREDGVIRIPAVVLGTADRARELLGDLSRERVWGYNVQGVVMTGEMTKELANIGSTPVVGSLANLVPILERLRPSEVLISMDHSDHAELLRIVSECAECGCRVKIVPDMYEIVSGQARTHQIYGAPLIDVNPELMQPWEAFAKRALDLVVSASVLILGAPVWGLTALAVKLTSKGPAFYFQDRVGRHGSVFKMGKFRSMYVNDRRGPTWTKDNDPRVTVIGRFLRKSHLDEIPQLWNVLRGEMSLVGPRPEQPFYVDKFTQMLPYYRRRHKVRPGITGWWQVKTKSNPESREEIENRLRYDFFYIENISFKLDLEILVRTIFVMLRGHGQA